MYIYDKIIINNEFDNVKINDSNKNKVAGCLKVNLQVNSYPD